MNVNWEVFIGIVVTIIVLGVIILLIRNQDYKQLRSLLTTLNQNVPLQNAIEGATKGVPAEVVTGLIGVFNLVLPFVASNPDLADSIEQFKQFVTKVTDGKPNDTATLTTATISNTYPTTTNASVSLPSFDLTAKG